MGDVSFQKSVNEMCKLFILQRGDLDLDINETKRR